MARIVVVDDDITNVTLTQMLLELDGFQVETCTNIQQAEAAASGTDAFVIDYYLSRGASGLQLLEEVRQGKTAAAKDTIVIVTSGDHRREEESINAGANLFLNKPYPPEELSKELSSLIQARKKHG